jgi:uncharacterized membrane protein
MAKIVDRIEVARPASLVFTYLDELERRGEWQAQILSSKRETPGPTHLGTRVTDVRRVRGGKQTVTYEVIEYDPPEKLTLRGIDGRVRPSGTITVDPLDSDRSLVTIELDFVGSGALGKIAAPIARRRAGKSVPADLRRLKARLELTA